MTPIHVFTEEESNQLGAVLNAIPQNPYTDHAGFFRSVAAVAGGSAVPEALAGAVRRIRQERADGTSNIHLLGNCPVDPELPELSWADPVADKRALKKTFLGEAFLALVASLGQTPLMAYSSRNNGDFFTDVVAIERFQDSKQTGYSDGELVYHNDRTAHWARADYIALLGLRCPERELIYTNFVDGRRLLERIPAPLGEVLRQPLFITRYDVYSRAANKRQQVSEQHAIFEGNHRVRYLDTLTRVAPGAPDIAKDALLGLRDALVLTDKQRHRMRTGDLLMFANQAGLHSRDRMEINDARRARTRWLLKTYSFADDAAADRFAGKWHGGVRGLISD